MTLASSSPSLSVTHDIDINLDGPLAFTGDVSNCINGRNSNSRIRR